MAGQGYQPPAQSGNDVLAYQGNAALGGGFDQKAYDSGANSLVPLDQLMKQLGGQQFAWNTMQYKQAVDDRDTTLSLLQKGQLDDEILDKDRDLIMLQRDDINKTVLKNPNILQDLNAYSDLQKKIAGMKDLAVSSKARNIAVKAQRLAAVNDPNLESRQARIAHLQDQIDKGPLHQIDPYFDNPSFNYDDYFKPVATEQIGPSKFDNSTGVPMEVKTMRTPLEKLFEPFNEAKLLANNGKGLQDIGKFYNRLVESPVAQDDNFWNSVNAQADRINKDNGLSISDPRYVQHGANKQGDQWVLNPNQIQMAKALQGLYHYDEKTSNAVSKDYSKVLLDKSTIAKNKAAGALDYAKIGTEKSKASYYDRLGQKALKEGDFFAAKTFKLKADISPSAEETARTWASLSKLTGYAKVSDVTNKTGNANKDFSPVILESLKKEAGVSDDWEMTNIPKNRSAFAMLSTPATGKDGKVTGDGVQPTHAFFVRPPDGDLKKAILVGVDDKGHVTKMLNINQAPVELYRNLRGYQLNTKDDEVNAASEGVMHNILYGNEGASGDQPVEISEEQSSSTTEQPTQPVGDYEVDGKNYHWDGTNLTPID